MVTALVVNEPATAAARLAAVVPGLATQASGGPVRTAARSGGSTAFTCRVPAAG
jgi:hypothetical protein